MFGILSTDYILGLLVSGLLIVFLVDAMYSCRSSETNGFLEVTNFTRKKLKSTTGVEDKVSNDQNQRQEIFITTSLLSKTEYEDELSPHIHGLYMFLDSTGGTNFKIAHSPSKTRINIDPNVLGFGCFGQQCYYL